MKKIEEFKVVDFKRDETYFKDGFASWEVTWHKKKWYVNAIYSNDAIVKNELSKDYTNGIKGFELCNDKLKLVKTFKHLTKATTISVLEVEKFIVNYL